MILKSLSIGLYEGGQFTNQVQKLSVCQLKSQRALRKLLGSSCSTAVEHTPVEQNTVGSNLARCLAFSSLLFPISTTSLIQVPHRVISPYKKYAQPCSLRQSKLNMHGLSKKNISTKTKHKDLAQDGKKVGSRCWQNENRGLQNKSTTLASLSLRHYNLLIDATV